MAFLNININSYLNSLLYPAVKKAKQVLWLQSLFSPVKQQAEEYQLFRDTAWFNIGVNAQTLVFENYLNRLYTENYDEINDFNKPITEPGTKRIFIKNFEGIDSDFISDEEEDLDFVLTSAEGEDPEISINVTAEGELDLAQLGDFSVLVLDNIRSTQQKIDELMPQIQATVEKVKVANRQGVLLLVAAS